MTVFATCLPFFPFFDLFLQTLNKFGLGFDYFFSDERSILNFFKSDFFADSKSASPKNKLYFILYKNYTNREPRIGYPGEERINDWRFREDCKEVSICTSDLTALTEEVGTNLH